MISKPVGESEIRSTTPSPTLRDGDGAKEILIQASQFCSEVEDRITERHPSLKKEKEVEAATV
jgi:hypothetical protein